MDFAPNTRTVDLLTRLRAFDEELVRPAETVYRAQREASGDPHFPPPVMEELKAEAKRQIGRAHV